VHYFDINLVPQYRLSELVPSNREILVVPCAPSASIRPVPLSEELALRAGVADKSGYFLTVGSLEPRKNLKTLMEAYAQLPSDLAQAHPLVVVGGTAVSFAESVQEHTSPNIRFVGYLSDEDLGALYGSAKAFISVSLAEGFGIPVVEAMACGCPLIISDIPVYQWISGGQARFVDPTSPDSISSEIALAATDELRSIDYPQLAQRFSWDQSASAVSRLLERLAGA
jgi:glycosyltransferase involved in cell wall biosynthesis